MKCRRVFMLKDTLKGLDSLGEALKTIYQEFQAIYDSRREADRHWRPGEKEIYEINTSSA